MGTTVHCIELKPGKGAEIARSAGTSAQILGREMVNMLLYVYKVVKLRKS